MHDDPPELRFRLSLELCWAQQFAFVVSTIDRNLYQAEGMRSRKFIHVLRANLGLMYAGSRELMARRLAGRKMLRRSQTSREARSGRTHDVSLRVSKFDIALEMMRFELQLFDIFFS